VPQRGHHERGASCKDSRVLAVLDEAVLHVVFEPHMHLMVPRLKNLDRAVPSLHFPEVDADHGVPTRFFGFLIKPVVAEARRN
jgi:hypothetical protein